MQQLLHPICLTLAVVGFLLLVWPPRHLCEDRARAALVGVYGFCAVSFLASLEPVWKMLGDVTGSHSIGILVAFGSVTAQMAAQTAVLAYWALAPGKAHKRVRLYLMAGAVILLALLTLYLLLPPSGPSTPQSFNATHVQIGVYQAYLTLYVVAYILGQSILAVGCWSAAYRTDEVWIARGLRVVGTGAIFTFGYGTIRLAGVGAVAIGLPRPPKSVESLAWIFADGGNTLVLSGFFIPTLAVHVFPRLRDSVRTHRDYRSLAPLWEELNRAMPTIVLEPAQSAVAARMPVWGTPWRLYRRAVEIRDGQWALQHHLEKSVATTAEERHRAAGLSGTELAAAVTADQLRAALDAHGRGGSPRTVTEYADAGIREEVRSPDDDVRALVRIAAHFDAAPAAGTADGHRPAPLLPTGPEN
ncbi:MAB_1171c family putative transporter [Streptomyces sp. NPDC054932]